MAKPNLAANLPGMDASTKTLSLDDIDKGLFDVPAAPVVMVAPSPRGEPAKSTTAKAAPAKAAPAKTEFEEEEIVKRVIFSAQLKPDLFLLLRQYEHHAEVPMWRILDEAMRTYLSDKPESHQPLPPRAAAKYRERIRRK